MRIEILAATPSPLEVVYKACRTCYSPLGPIDMKLTDRDSMIALINETMTSGHHSVLEHICFTIAIDGVSRALTHQLVRHRLASYSQQSQRYVNYAKNQQETAVGFVEPLSIQRNPQANDLFQQVCNTLKTAYKQLVDLGIPAEDARYLLPNATESKLVMTMNYREILAVSSIRLCYRAQWEIVELFALIKKSIAKIDSFLGSKLLPKCQHNGYCSESKPCGKYKFNK